MLTLPVFYFPSTVVWVDDDTLFLQAAKFILKNDLLKVFNKPSDCIQFFANYISPLNKLCFLRGAIEDERYDDIDYLPVELNVPSFQKIHHQAELNNEVSILIVDYDMHELNGIELCKKLKSQPMKKILLTGAATQDEAIAAFNDNLIDRFISKDSPTLVQDIQKYVSELQQEFFCEQTQSLLSHLQADEKLPLTDPVFIKFFQEFCDRNEIVEYSLIDKIGSLRLRKKHSDSVLIIHTERSLNYFIELNQDTRDAEFLVSLVSRRQRIPFFGIGRASWEFEAGEWGEFLHLPKVLEGRERYYYAVCEKV